MYILYFLILINIIYMKYGIFLYLIIFLYYFLILFEL